MKKAFFSDLHFLGIIFLFIHILLPDPANAGYLDPGSGSTLVQVIIGFFASIQRFIRRLFGKKD